MCFFITWKYLWCYKNICTEFLLIGYYFIIIVGYTFKYYTLKQLLLNVYHLMSTGNTFIF